MSIVTTITEVKSITKTLFNVGDKHWINLVILMRDGSTTEVDMFATDGVALEHLDRSLAIGELRNQGTAVVG